jgi:hypothetical protein
MSLFYKALAPVMQRNEEKTASRKPRAQPVRKESALKVHDARMTQLQKCLDDVKDGFLDGTVGLDDLVVD